MRTMRNVLTIPVAIVTLTTFMWAQGFTGFNPGNLVVSRSVYQGTASTVTIGQALPPSCPAGNAGCTHATENGEFPNLSDSHNVWNNDGADGSFGVTSPIFLDQITTGGVLVNTLNIDPTQVVTSFSSKSELALNLTPDGTAITFGAYSLGTGNSTSLINMLDVSNSNTPGIFDATNPVGGASSAYSFYRAVGQVNASGALTLTVGNAYGGNNGRAVVYGGNGWYYMVGNSNNGSSTVFNSITQSTGVELLAAPPATQPTTQPPCTTGVTVTVGPCVIMVDPTLQYGTDKPGKDNNYRGVTISPNGTLYVSKGSGSNGVDTVFQVGNIGSLPTPANAAATTIAPAPGFPTFASAPAKKAGINNIYPFGIWFANANTMYVADEGDGVVADAAASIYAGLQKWVYNGTTWSLAYVMQNGLGLGQQYSVANYPTSLNPATAGLRNITGRVNSDGTATIWALTSTVSANGDQGADPNRLVAITDDIANANAAAAAGEPFSIVKSADYGEVLRGVSLTPGTLPGSLPTPAPSLGVTSSAFSYSRASHTYNGTISIQNNGSSSVTGPYSVELTALTGGVAVSSAHTTVSGNPTVSVVANGVTLQPGQSASAAASFTDSSNVLITFTPVVVAQ